MPSNTKVTVTFTRQLIDDNSPADISWLDHTDAQMGDGFEASAASRKRAYERGDWHMVGIRAKATIWIERAGCRTDYTIESPGLWGIESDSGEAYFATVFADECATLRADIEAMAAAEFKS